MHKLPVHPQTHALIKALLTYRDALSRSFSNPEAAWSVVDACLTAHPLTDPVPDFEHGRTFTPYVTDDMRRVTPPPATTPVTGDQVSSDPKLCRCWYKGWGNDIVGTVFTCRHCGSKATLVGGRWTSGKWAMTPPPAATPPPPTPASPDPTQQRGHPATHTLCPESSAQQPLPGSPYQHPDA